MTNETEKKLFDFLSQEFNVIALTTDMQDIEHIILSDQPQPILALEAERWAWSQTTFPEATAVSSLRKAESEILEIEKDLEAGQPIAEEYADAMMCLFDSAQRAGLTPESIIEAYALKVIKNKARTWAKNPDNSYSHIK